MTEAVTEIIFSTSATTRHSSTTGTTPNLPSLSRDPPRQQFGSFLSGLGPSGERIGVGFRGVGVKDGDSVRDIRDNNGALLELEEGTCCVRRIR